MYMLFCCKLIGFGDHVTIHWCLTPTRLSAIGPACRSTPHCRSNHQQAMFVLLWFFLNSVFRHRPTAAVDFSRPVQLILIAKLPLAFVESIIRVINLPDGATLSDRFDEFNLTNFVSTDVFRIKRRCLKCAKNHRNWLRCLEDVSRKYGPSKAEAPLCLHYPVCINKFAWCICYW